MNLLTRIFIISAVLSSIIVIPEAHAGWNPFKKDKTEQGGHSKGSAATAADDTEANTSLDEAEQNKFKLEVEEIFEHFEKENPLSPYVLDDQERFERFQKALESHGEHLTLEQVNKAMTLIFTFSELHAPALLDAYKSYLPQSAASSKHALDTILQEGNYEKLQSFDIFQAKNSSGGSFLDEELKATLIKKGITQLDNRDYLIQNFMENYELGALGAPNERTQFKEETFTTWAKIPKEQNDEKLANFKAFVEAYESLDSAFEMKSTDTEKTGVPNE